MGVKLFLPLRFIKGWIISHGCRTDPSSLSPIHPLLAQGIAAKKKKRKKIKKKGFPLRSQCKTSNKMYNFRNILMIIVYFHILYPSSYNLLNDFKVENRTDQAEQVKHKNTFALMAKETASGNPKAKIFLGYMGHFAAILTRFESFQSHKNPS